jgi:uncharacterized protein RhaS with RHS repeats
LNTFTADDDCDGPDDIIETRESGALIDSYVYKPNGGLTVYSLRAGGPARFYHSDELGNVFALTGTNGVVNERYEWDYGAPAVLTSDAIPRAQMFRPRAMRSFSNGMEWDHETGLYFEKHWPCRYEGPRYYDAQTGRYVSARRNSATVRER